MADPRLQWRTLNTSQPNVAGLLRGANESLNNAGDAAAGILERYDSGQKTKGDQELARLLASTNDRDALTELVNSEAVMGLNLSEDGVRMLNEAQGNRVDWANTDSTVRDRDGRLVLAQNVDGRAGDKHGIYMREDARNVAQRDYLQKNAANYTQAELDALNSGTSLNRPRKQGEFVRAGDHVFGNADPGQGPVKGNTGSLAYNSQTLVDLARTIQAEAGNQGAEGMLAVGAVIRNRAASGKYGEGIDGVIKKPGQFSAWNSETGYAGGEQGQDMNFQPNAEALQIAQAILDGKYKDNTQGATHYYNPDISQPDWGGPVINGEGAPRASQGRGFGGDHFTAAMANSGLFTPGEIAGTVGVLRTAGQAGDVQNEEDRQELIANFTTKTIDDLSKNEKVTTDTIVQETLNRIDKTNLPVTEVERAQLEQNIIAQIEGSGRLQKNLNPGQSEAERLIAETAQERASSETSMARKAIGGTPEAQMITDAESYAEMGSTDDKARALIGNLRLTDEDFANSPWFGRDADFDPSTMVQHLDKAHRELRRIDPTLTVDEVYALASRVFEADPLFRNTLEKQLDIGAMEDILESLSGDGERVFQEARIQINDSERKMQANQTQIAKLESRARRSGISKTAKEDLKKQISALRKDNVRLSGLIQEISGSRQREEAETAAKELGRPNVRNQ